MEIATAKSVRFLLVTKHGDELFTVGFSAKRGDEMRSQELFTAELLFNCK